MLGRFIAGKTGTSLYIDSIGYILAACLGGFLPGIAVGYISNVINVFQGIDNLYYGIVSIIVACAATMLYRSGIMKKIWGAIVSVLVFALLGGGVGVIITWLLYGADPEGGIVFQFFRDQYANGNMGFYGASFISNYALDIIDKALCTSIVLIIIALIPKKLRDEVDLRHFKQKPLTKSELKEMKSSFSRTTSLGAKIVMILAFSILALCVVAGIICFVCIDLTAGLNIGDKVSFITKEITLFSGFASMVFALALWLAKYHLLIPINTMSVAAAKFAYNDDEAIDENVEQMKALDIRTGDEIEHLYETFTKTMVDTVNYMEDAKKQNENLNRMQNGLIMVLADMVESRDKSTGDHILKTREYAKMLVLKLKEKGDYHPEIVTDEFVENVIRSAPLHDVGKIKISDVILNKPGRLDEFEFEIMKTHTTCGKEIIDNVISLVTEAGYLDEAKNMATYHHEKWNGKGYPTGLKGEEIPLSARIMAIADVFDALVSRRCYKEPFPIEKALDIIREDSGVSFDPYLAQLFLDNEEEVREIAKMNLRNIG